MKWNVIDKCVCMQAHEYVYVELLPRSFLDVGLYFTLECYSHLFTTLHSKAGNSTTVLTDRLFTTLHHTTSISTTVLTDRLFTTLHHTTSNSTIILIDHLFTTLHHTTSISTTVVTDYLFTTLHHKSCIPTTVLTDHLCTAILQEQIKLVVEFILQEVGEVIRVNLA